MRNAAEVFPELDHVAEPVALYTTSLLSRGEWVRPAAVGAELGNEEIRNATAVGEWWVHIGDPVPRRALLTFFHCYLPGRPITSSACVLGPHSTRLLGYRAHG